MITVFLFAEVVAPCAVAFFWWGWDAVVGRPQPPDYYANCEDGENDEWYHVVKI